MTKSWYGQVTQDLGCLPNCITHFEDQLNSARQDLNLKGRPLEKIAAELPGVVEHRYGQLQETEAILEYLNIELRRLRSQTFRQYLENYNRALSSRDVEKYVDGDADVVSFSILVNEFALLRNKWIGLHKALEQANWQISNVIKLRVAGLDDATV